MNQAITNKFIVADPLFTVARNGGQPNYVYGNSGDGDWNSGQNIYMSKFALGDNGGASCGRGGVRSGACAAIGRMLRPDDSFVQTIAAPEVTANAAGTTFVRSNPTTLSSDPTTNTFLQQMRQSFNTNMQLLMSKQGIGTTQTNPGIDVVPTP